MKICKILNADTKATNLYGSDEVFKQYLVDLI